jgi:predicted nucleic acid-binding protein
MAKAQRIYWDACAWIAFIAEEKAVPLKGGGTENRYGMCLNILEAARKGKYEIVTSAFTLAEVCKSPEVVVSPIDNLPAFFEKSYILIVPVDLAIGRRAQSMQATGLVKLKPADTVHLASAQRAKVAELHTFDDRILALDNQIVGGDGNLLKICRPTQGAPIGPLFEGIKNDPETKPD